VVDLYSKEKSRRIHKTYFKEIQRLFRFVIPEGMRVLELGCNTGRLLADVKPAYGLGVDSDPESIVAARDLFQDRPELHFKTDDIETSDWSSCEPFDYIVLSDIVPLLKDIQTLLQRIQPLCKPDTRLIINFHNNVWFPALRLARLFGWRRSMDRENWLSTQDIENLLYLANYEVITKGTRVLIPVGIPALTPFFNRVLAKFPVFQHLCLACYIVARPEPGAQATVTEEEPSVTILVPTRNERGNVQGIFQRTPIMGKWTELVFVDGNSDDGTVEAIEAGMIEHKAIWKRTKFLQQTGIGKGQAVRQGFEVAEGDILMILDSDLTMPPEDLPKYYSALVSRRGEFINGSRLVYTMEKRAMRFLNMIANKLFAVLFTWLLGQPVKDTLCGTKILWKKDYDKIASNRSYFGDFDPFGDFDLLFGAAKLNLKIVDLPIRYREREYGDIKISRWTHGMLLVKMCWIAFKKLKLS